jgi:hypothetical protein
MYMVDQEKLGYDYAKARIAEGGKPVVQGFELMLSEVAHLKPANLFEKGIAKAVSEYVEEVKLAS